MNWTDILKTIAPTVASAALGPLGGMAVAAIGNAIGIDSPTQDKIAKAFKDGQLSPETVSKLRELEMKYKSDEAERGFKYSELEFQDRDSARKANVAGGTQMPLFWLSLILLTATLGCEIFVLLNGYPPNTPEMVVGRILGLLDAVAMMVLVYWYGSNKDSQRKTDMLAHATIK